MQLSLTLAEIIVLMAGAISLGITIHFFIVSRRSLKSISFNQGMSSYGMEEGKLRYFNDLEKKEQELASLRRERDQALEKCRQLQKETEGLHYRLRSAEKHVPAEEPPAEGRDKLIRELRVTREGLAEQNDRLASLLERTAALGDLEGNNEELFIENEELKAKLEEAGARLEEKERELSELKKSSTVSHEMGSMLDSAYEEFHTLQDKMAKLESQVNHSRRISMEYEDVKEGLYKTSRDLEEQRHRLSEAIHEIRRLKEENEENGEKLREANFQRQQLQKKVAYLEELNHDLQSVAEANRKLELQLKRIGELESLLNVITEERDELSRRQVRASSH